MKDNRIALLIFGTFNPITNAYVQLGLSAKEIIEKQEGLPCDVFYIPSNLTFMQDWKNVDNTFLTDSERLELVYQSIEPYGFEVLDYDISQQYTDGRTYNTVLAVRSQCGYSNIYLCVGYDKLSELEKWFMSDFLFSECKTIVFARDNMKLSDCQDEFIQNHRNQFIEANIELPHISSTMVRLTYQERRYNDIHEMVPTAVYDHLIENARREKARNKNAI